MAYDGKNLPLEIPETPEPEDKDTVDGPPLRVRIVAGTVAGALAFAAAPHGLACASPDVFRSLLCKAKVPVRHDLHVEVSTGVFTTSATESVSIALISPDPNGLQDPPDGWVLNLPKSG